MNSFVDNWDLSHSSSSFSHLPDDDFLAILQNQFPAENTINPSYSLAPSEDSSPSPDDDQPDPALKRKASDESIQGGPSQKTQHTGNIPLLILLVFFNPIFIISKQQKVDYSS